MVNTDTLVPAGMLAVANTAAHSLRVWGSRNGDGEVGTKRNRDRTSLVLLRFLDPFATNSRY